MKWLIALTLLTGCQSETTRHAQVHGGIYRWADSTNGVVCYTVYQAGIACLRP